MKKCVVLAATAALLTCPCICFASYVVQLTNGTQFVVHQYWEEANQIRFYSRGGAVGIPKGCVREIKESDATPSSPQTAETLGKEVDQALETSPGERAGEEIVGLEEHYKTRTLRLRGELNRVLERFRHSSANKDSEARKKAIKDMTRVSGQLIDLADELRKKNNGTLPHWWEDL